MQRFSLAALVPTPWKNGGGMTREIVCRPALAGTGDFSWRASVATIAADGPFSTYPGIDRVIVLLDGGGVRLRSADGSIDHRLDTPLAPFTFAGEASIDATLLAGGSTDFNLMTRRATCRAQVAVLHSAATLPAAAQGVLMAVQGDWQAVADDGAVHAVPAQQGLWWHDAPVSWRLRTQDTGAALLAVRIAPATP